MTTVHCLSGGQNSLHNIDIIGCRRRSTYDLQDPSSGMRVDFHCDGQEGPPCTVRIGDTIIFNTTITTGINFTIAILLGFVL